MPVAHTEPANDPGTCDGGVDDRDNVTKLGFERGVEVGGAAWGDEAVGVGQHGEGADFVVVFELCAYKKTKNTFGE